MRAIADETVQCKEVHPYEGDVATCKHEEATVRCGGLMWVTEAASSDLRAVGMGATSPSQQLEEIQISVGCSLLGWFGRRALPNHSTIVSDQIQGMIPQTSRSAG